VSPVEAVPRCCSISSVSPVEAVLLHLPFPSLCSIPPAPAKECVPAAVCVACVAVGLLSTATAMAPTASSDGVVPSAISAPISFGLPILDLKLTGRNYREWTLSQNVVVFCWFCFTSY
jgi:hypothetical protein